MAKSRYAVLAAFLLVLSQVCVAQQATTGSIAGSVVDQSGAVLPGASVKITSERGSRDAVTDARGRFLVPYLTPGSYTARVDLQGFRSVERSNVAVRVGQKIDLELVMEVGQFAEAMEVSGASPLVDFSSASSGSTLESSLLETVPVGRRLGDTLYLAPGVSSGGAVGQPNPSISGATGLENQYVVDGVSINNQRYGSLGVYERGYGALGTGVTYEFIDEIEVRTAGTEAEFAQSSGGVVNVITKSGSNEWHGTLFAYFRPDRLEGDRREVTLPSGAVNTTASQTSEIGFTLGGPIVADRAFFFVALDPQRERTTMIAPQGVPLAGMGEVDRERSVNPYAAKATFQISADHRLDLSVFGDPAEGEMGPQSSTALTYVSTGAFSSLEYGSQNQTLRYQGALSPEWLLEASVGRSRSDFGESPLLDEWQVIDYTVSPSLTTGGKGTYNPGSQGESLQYQLRSTNLIGNHDLRYGASFEDITYGFLDGYTGPPITLRNGQTTGSGVAVNVVSDPTFGKIYRVVGGRQTADKDSFQQSWSLFLQDKVLIGDRLTVSAGLRYENEKMGGSIGSISFKDNWAPRLGVVFDPTGRGKVKVFGSAGVFFMKIPNSVGVLSFGGGGFRIFRADYYDAALTQPIPDGVLAGGLTSHLLLSATRPAQVDPIAKLGYIREGTLGVEFQAAPELSVGARVVYRDMPRIFEDIGRVSLTLLASGDPAGQGVATVFGNPSDGYPETVNDVGAFEKLVHKYRALELTLDKRLADRWILFGSYRWSRLWGSYEGFFRNDMGAASPAQSSLFDYPMNDPTYTEIGVPQYGFKGDIRYQGALGAGPLPTDRPHQLKVYGAYSLDVGLNVGAGLAAGSGRPLTPMAANPASNRRGDIPEAPRGTGIETEDGFKTRTPFEWSFDLHADYGFALAGGRLVLAADVFNVFNLQRVVDYDQNTQRAYRVSNPDFGLVTQYQEPRQVRLGVRFEI